MTRTTFAVTTLSGSPALNVIAQKATAGVNIRIMVGDTVDDVLEHVRTAIDDDQVRIDVVEANEPSPVSPMTSDDDGVPAAGGDDHRGLPGRRRRRRT